MRRGLHVSRSRFVDDDEGLTLIELMAAIFILTVAVLTIAAAASTSLLSIRNSRVRQEAVNAATSMIEELRALDYRDIAVASGSGAPSTFEGEPVVTSSSPTAVAFTTTAGHNGQISRRTLVTQTGFDHDGDGGTSTPDIVAKRITVISRWTSRGGDKEVREQTVVAPVDRGLPVPQFVLSPATPTQVQHNQVDAVSDAALCVPHDLFNVGAPDRYEVRITTGSDPESVTLSADGLPARFEDDTSDWFAQAYLDLSNTQPPPSSSKMETAAAGWVQLDSTVVPTQESAVLTVCYEPHDPEVPPSSPESVTSAAFLIEVRSRFDDRVVQTVTDRLVVGDTFAQVFLHDRDNTRNHARNNSNFTMDSTAPTQVGMFNYDTNRDPDGLPGIYLPVGDTSQTGIWDWDSEFANDVSLRRADVTLYTSWLGALTQSTPPNRNLAYVVRLEHVAADGTSVLRTLDTQVLRYSHNGQGWKSNTVVLDWSTTPVTLGPNQFLRLRVWCAGTASGSASEAPCHLMYDQASRASNMVVQ